jgi:5-hydroxyisourate hydrolase
MSLTTHVLDVVRGVGAAGMVVDAVAPDGAVASVVLDESGRAVLFEKIVEGTYEISFHAGAYQGGSFYGVIPVRFDVTDVGRHYHVPLVLSAYGYSTYRGG